MVGPYSPVPLLAVRLKTEILAEERQHIVLEANRDRAGVRAGIDLESIRDSVAIQDVVELGRIEP